MVSSKIRYTKSGAEYAISENNVMMFLSGESSLEYQLSVLNPQTMIKPLFEQKGNLANFQFHQTEQKLQWK